MCGGSRIPSGWSSEEQAGRVGGAGSGEGGLEDREVLSLLDRLAEKSLVGLVGTADEPRYGLLETVRQYAAERLASAGEEQALRDRHLAWCLALAEESEPKLNGPEQAAWLRRLEIEHDNLRAALAWAHRSGDRERELRLATTLHRFWNVRGYLSEGRAWLEAALASDGGARVSAMVRAGALNAAGTLASNQGDYTPASARFEESLALQRGLNDTAGVASSLNGLGNLAYRQCDYPRAIALHEEALALRRALGDVRGVAASLSNLGVAVALQGDHTRSAALFEEALLVQREAGDAWSVAASLNNLGLARDMEGENKRAEAAFVEALALRRELGDLHGVAVTLRNLGRLRYANGDHAQGNALLEESLALRRELGDRLGVADALDYLGNAAYRRGDHARAAAMLREGLEISRVIGAADVTLEILENLAGVFAAYGQPYEATQLCGAVQALRESIGVRPQPEGEAVGGQTASTTRVALGEQLFNAAWTAGRAMSLEQAVALALTEGPGQDEMPTGTTPAQRQSSRRR